MPTYYNGRMICFSESDFIYISGIPGATWTTLQDFINQIGAAGSGNTSYITDAGGAAIDVAGGDGFIRIADTENALLKAFSWAAAIGIAIPADTARYIGIEYNAGAPQVVVKITDTWDWHTEFRLGSVVNEGGTLHILNNPQQVSDSLAHLYERFYECQPLQRANRLGGIIPGETGVRNLTVSAGELYDGLNEFDVGNIDTSGADTFDAYYGDGGGGFNKIAAVSQWDNLQYDGGAGALVALLPSKWGVHWLYIEADNNLVLIYGDGEWSTQAMAEESAAPSTVPLRLQVQGRLIGRIVFQQAAATAADIQDVWEQDFNLNNVTSHLNLTEIGTNTHAQIDAFIAAHGGPVSFYAETLPQEGTASVVFVSLSTPVTITLPKGKKYLINWSCGLATNNVGFPTPECRLLDVTGVSALDKSTEEAAPIAATSFSVTAGMALVDLTLAGVDNVYELDYRKVAGTGSGNVDIKNARISAIEVT